VLVGFLELLIVTACSSARKAVIPTPVPSSTPLVAAGNKSLPTPAFVGQMVVYDNLQVTMTGAEVTNSYLTEYGSNREPPADKKFLWIRLLLKNISPSERNLPAPEHFSVLNVPTEFKAAYGHRKDHTDYMALTTVMVPGQIVDAWLRFDIPAAMKLKELWFAYLPESSQISFGFSSSDYPWADHPIYLWACAP
jgi:hypothetical protein